MDGSSSIDESTTTDAISTMRTPTKMAKPESDCRRVFSGGSIVTDSDNGAEADSRKLTSSRFKGVVPQPNGRWGAQIYEKHQRIWLGTFVGEEEAARAYDTAVRKFRGHDAVTNLKPKEAETEVDFLNSHSKSEIVDMLRKHTYDEELEQSRRKQGRETEWLSGFTTCAAAAADDAASSSSHELLFEKTVTPSDVGKLNRLVIPKQQAVKHFPLPGGIGNGSKGTLLSFKDRFGKVWRFRYSYWNSSQSYVLTKGWSRFVKERKLRAGDIIIFRRSENQFSIDWRTGDNIGSIENDVLKSVRFPSFHMVRLFGVNIMQVPMNREKRVREVEVLGLTCCKKQRVIKAL